MLDHKDHITSSQLYHGSGGVVHSSDLHAFVKTGHHVKKVLNPIGSVPTGAIDGQMVEWVIKPNTDIKGIIDDVTIVLNLYENGGPEDNFPAPLPLMINRLEIFLNDTDSPAQVMTGKELMYMFFQMNPQAYINRWRNLTGFHVDTTNSDYAWTSPTSPIYGTTFGPGESRIQMFPLQYSILNKLPIAQMKSDIRVRITFVRYGLTATSTVDAGIVQFSPSVQPVQLIFGYNTDSYQNKQMHQETRKMYIPYCQFRMYQHTETVTENQDIDIRLPIHDKGKVGFLWWNCLEGLDEVDYVYGSADFELDRSSTTDLNQVYDLVDASNNSVIGGKQNMRIQQYDANNLYPNTVLQMNPGSSEQTFIWPINFCSDPESFVNGDESGYRVFDQDHWLRITGNQSLAAGTKYFQFYFCEHKGILLDLQSGEYKRVD